MPLRWGIAGCSDITSKRVAPAIRDHPLAALTAFYSTDAERGRRFAEEFGATRAHTDLDAFVADPEIDAVYVASPVDRHLSETLAAAGAGKHVLCEKPMALDAVEGARMVRRVPGGRRAICRGLLSPVSPADPAHQAVARRGGHWAGGAGPREYVLLG